MAYVTTANVQQLVGTNYDSTNDVDGTRLTAIVAEVDAHIDTRLRDVCYPFNATGDTPATPRAITRIAQRLSAEQLLVEIGMRDRSESAANLGAFFGEQGSGWLTEIVSNWGWTKPESKTGETLTFGQGDDAASFDLDDSEAIIGATSPLSSGDPPHVIPESVFLSTSSTVGSVGYSAATLALARIGVEFEVEWNPRRRRWIFTALDSDLYNAVTTLKIDYKWTYQRDYTMSDRPSHTVFS